MNGSTPPTHPFSNQNSTQTTHQLHLQLKRHPSCYYSIGTEEKKSCFLYLVGATLGEWRGGGGKKRSRHQSHKRRDTGIFFPLLPPPKAFFQATSTGQVRSVQPRLVGLLGLPASIFPPPAVSNMKANAFAFKAGKILHLRELDRPS